VICRRPFHTFNARSNALLQIVRADGSFSLQAMRDEIQVAYQDGGNFGFQSIQHSDLNNALTPQLNRREVALVFDTSNMTEV
jgi:hypothetical protein